MNDPRVENAKNLKLAAPAALHDKPIWLLWRLEQGPKDRKPRKVPYRIDGAVRKGVQNSADDLAGKGTLDEALAAYQRGDYHGIGIAPHAGAGVAVIDLDACVGSDGMPTPQAAQVIEKLDTYSELSPSGTGVHVIALADMKSAKAMNRWGPGQHAELFATSGFVTFTGVSVNAPDARPVNGMGDWLGTIFTKPAAAEHAGSAPLDDPRRVRDLKAALGHLDANDYDLWIEVGMALATAGDEGRALWLEWSETSDKFDPDEAQSKWASFTPNGTNWKSVFVKAKAAGWDGKRAKSAPPAAPDAGMEIIGGLFVRASQIKPENVRWLWDGKLALDTLTLLAGAPGTGKTQIALKFAAIVSSGGEWPDGTQATKGTVIVWAAEDTYRSATVPRLIAAGADMDNVLLLGVPGAPHFDPAEHMEQLMAALNEIDDVALLVIDPIMALVTGDSHKAAEVRRDLTPLVDLLHARGIAGLGVTHFAKGTQGRATLDRVLGSGAFGQLARGVFGTAGDQESGDYRLVNVKIQYGVPGGGFAYRIEERVTDGIRTSTVVWGDTLLGHPDRLLAEMEGNKGGRPSKRDPASVLLTELLKGGEPVPYADIVKAGEKHGISETTLYRVGKSMNIVKVKAKGRDGKGTWQMPGGTP